MNYNELFYLVYISQIVLISVVIPFWAVKRVNHMLDNYPPENYAKLYPVSTTTIKYAINTFKLLSAMMVLIGGVIIGITVSNSADELMNWDSQSMLTITFFLQLLPFLYLGLSGVKYQQLMRKVSQSTQRKANLKPRKVSDYVSKHLLVAAMVSFLAYTLMVVYIQQNPFPGFVGYWNILFVLLLNAFYFFMVHRIISGRKSDPHQAQEDRMIHLSLVAKLLIMAAILCNLFLTINLVLSMLDLRHIGDIIQSLYFQLVALMMSQTATYEPDNYDVYRTDAKAV